MPEINTNNEVSIGYVDNQPVLFANETELTLSCGNGAILSHDGTYTNLKNPAGSNDLLVGDENETYLYGGGNYAVLLSLTTIGLLQDKVTIPEAVSKDFADDAAAAIGGIDVGQVYHTAGVLKIRLV